MGGIWGSKSKGKETPPAYLQVDHPGENPEQWDADFVDRVVADFQKRHGLNLKKDEIAVKRLQDAAARVRQELARGDSTRLNLPFLAADASGPKSLDVEIRRSGG